MDSAADDFMVIEKEYSDFSVFTHKRSLTHSFPVRPSLALAAGIPCRCSGGPGPCCQRCDQQGFAIFSIYLEIQAKSQVTGCFAVMRSTG